MNKIEKQAATDAQRWAAAEMFYGEGAGTRRKILNAELVSKFGRNPEYEVFFREAYDKLDMNKFAEKAIKERKAIDRAAKAGQNLRALKSGNINNLSTGVFIIVGGVWIAHQTGYDKKVEAEMKKLWARVKEEADSIKRSRRIRQMKLDNQ